MNIHFMRAELLTTLGEPKRLQIIEALVSAPKSVSELVELLHTSQPTVSKHLRILREAGVVSCKVEAQRRIYQLRSEPFQQLDAWLAAYRAMWEGRLDALENFLDAEDKNHAT